MRKTVFKIVDKASEAVAEEKPVELDFYLEKDGDKVVVMVVCESLYQTVATFVPGEGIVLPALFDSSIGGKITKALGTEYGSPVAVI